jgi:DNA-binding response OmpR family regulator
MMGESEKSRAIWLSGDRTHLFLEASSNVRVLVVDNERDAADTVAMLVRVAGMEAFVAYDGREAVDAARRIEPHVMLVDVGMPVFTGLDVVKTIRQCRELDGTFLCAMTGYADQEHRAMGLSAGFDEYLVKPIPYDRLIALLTKCRGTQRPLEAV